MAKITVTNDPTIYLRKSGLKPATYNKFHMSFEYGKNKEHGRPLPSVLEPNSKVKI